MVLTLPFWALSLISPALVLGLMLDTQTPTFTQFSYYRVYMAILPV